MNAKDTIKDVVRIATTAGLAKDVIDLLEKKTTLLGEQVVALELENTTLLRENRNLTSENQQLKTQIQNVRPKAELSDQTTAILKYFFDKAGEVSDREIAQRFQISTSVTSYHIDVLWKKNFIGSNRVIIMGGGSSGESKCEITSAGRAYCVENGLAG